MPTGNPGVRRGRSRCSNCGALGVKAPTCPGNRIDHALMAGPYVRVEMGQASSNTEPVWTSEHGWPVWETMTVVQEVTTGEPPEGWFNVGPIVAPEPVDVQEDIGVLERIAVALESIANTLK